MVQTPHNIDFIDEGLFSFFLTEGSFFGKSFDCILFSIFVLNDEINRSEVTFTYFLDGLEELMEASSIDFFSKEVSPLKKLSRNVGVFQRKGLIVSFELQCVGMTKFGPSIFLLIVSFEIEDEIKVEVDFESRGSFFSLNIKEINYGKLQDDIVLKEESLSILIDFVTHVEYELLLHDGLLGGGEVVYFLNKSLLEHHNGRMEYKKRLI